MTVNDVGDLKADALSKHVGHICSQNEVDDVMEFYHYHQM